MNVIERFYKNYEYVDANDKKSKYLINIQD